jgi:guanylate kinase
LAGAKKAQQMKKANPLIIIVSGPSGVGKDAVIAKMKHLGRPLYYAVTATTRPQRAGESDGLDYHFLSKREFQGMIHRGELLEWANVYGNLYGVPKQEVEKALAQGLEVIIKVDVQGAATLKRILPQAVFIFLAPPSFDELEKRLKQRNTESTKEFKLRIDAAAEEMKSLPMFDYVVINQQDRVDLTIAQIDAIITAERCRVKPREEVFGSARKRGL